MSLRPPLGPQDHVPGGPHWGHLLGEKHRLRHAAGAGLPHHRR